MFAHRQRPHRTQAFMVDVRIVDVARFGAKGKTHPRHTSRDFGRNIANAREAREIFKIGTFCNRVDETPGKNGFAPDRWPGRAGFTQYPS